MIQPFDVYSFVVHLDPGFTESQILKYLHQKLLAEEYQSCMTVFNHLPQQGIFLVKRTQTPSYILAHYFWLLSEELECYERLIFCLTYFLVNSVHIYFLRNQMIYRIYFDFYYHQKEICCF